MIKLRNFWVVLAIGCAFSMGTASCSDDEEEQNPQEQNGNKDTNKPEDQKQDAPATQPEKLGESMKEVVAKIDIEEESSLLKQATQMTSAQIETLAETLVEYNKNKDNKEWKDSFLGQATEEEKEKTVELIENTISKIEAEGIVMDELDKDILLEIANEYFKGTDGYGDGKKAGLEEGKTHEKLCNDLYYKYMTDLDFSTTEGMYAMMSVVTGLDSNQKGELMSIILAWDSKKDDKDWKSGFIEGVNLKDPAAAADMEEKLNQIVSNQMVMGMIIGVLS